MYGLTSMIAAVLYSRIIIIVIIVVVIVVVIIIITILIYYYYYSFYYYFPLLFCLDGHLLPLQVLLFFPSMMVVVSILLVVLPLWQNPYPQLMGLAASSLALPLYVFFLMEIPYKLKPRVVDRISQWLIATTSKIFNTQIHSKVC